MIVDTSAIIAVLRKEPERTAFLEAMTAAKGQVSMTAATLVETGIVSNAARDERISDWLRELIGNLQIAVAPITEELAWHAIDAHRQFGKGSGHPARLNFGDCFSYALAKTRNEPLLFKGADFAATEIEAAL